jgi:hypothetical protein
MFAKATTIWVVAKSRSILSYGHQTHQSTTFKAVVHEHHHHAATPIVPTYTLSTDLRKKKKQKYPLFKHVICSNQALPVIPELRQKVQKKPSGHLLQWNP